MADLNLIQILQETVSDCNIAGSISDKEVIKLLKMNLILKASEESYKEWHKGFDNPSSMMRTT